MLAQHLMGLACAAPFDADATYAEIRSAAPYAGLRRTDFDRTLGFISTGGYALAAYDRFRRLVQDADGRYRIAHPRLALQQPVERRNDHRSESAALNVRFGRRGRTLGKIEEWFGAQLRIGDSFIFAGLTLVVTGFDNADILVTTGRGNPRIPSYEGGKLPLTTHLATRVRGLPQDHARSLGRNARRRP